MQEDLSVDEFEAMITTIVHCVLARKGGSTKESFTRSEVALKYAIAANKIFADFGFNDLKAIFRRSKAFIIFEPTGRIACEIGIDGDYGNYSVRRSRAILMSRRGFVRSGSLRQLIDFTAKKGKTIYSNLSKEEIHAKRKAYNHH